MNKIRTLAGQTAIYGIPNIVGRILNYLLVPLHTQYFAPDTFSEVSYFFVFAALLLIIYTHGMETTYFRFSSKSKSPAEQEEYYSNAILSVLIVGLIFTIGLWIGADSVAAVADYPGSGHVVKWLAVIILMDGLVAIPFARMRIENKAKLFAVTKMANIIINISLQVFFIILLPDLVTKYSALEVFYQPELGVGYIFLANLIANLIMGLMVWRYFLNVRFKISKQLYSQMIAYGSPILLTGIAGWFSMFFDRILIKDMLSKFDLGVYDQTFKLAILTQLAVQAFRYAGEPFFFNNARDPEAPKLFAEVLHYFVLFSLLIFVGIGLNVDLIADILLRRPEYKTALYLVPILMMGKIFQGIYVNVSIWFKLKDKTLYGTYFMVIGAIISIAGNLILIPNLGMLGSAITVFVVYLVMTLICGQVGRKYMRIPYKVGTIAIHIIIASSLVTAAYFFSFQNEALENGVNILATLIYGLILWSTEKGKLKAKSF